MLLVMKHLKMNGTLSQKLTSLLFMRDFILKHGRLINLYGQFIFLPFEIPIVVSAPECQDIVLEA